MSDNGYTQGKKPSGKLGYFIGILMNQFQTKGHKALYDAFIPKKDVCLLDIGCGGGGFLHDLLKNNRIKHGKGMDHSEEMIKLISNKNRSFINDKKLSVIQCSVEKINLPEKSFDCITAMETIQFWPYLDRSLSEVYRVMKPGGILLIANRFPSESSSWYQNMQIKSMEEYRQLLENAHFEIKTMSTTVRNGWIVITAIRPL